MKVVLYSSVVDSLMYAQVCTRLDIAFVVSMLGRYLSDLGQSYWKAAKKVFRYLQGTKDLRDIDVLTLLRWLILVIPIIQTAWMIKSPLLVISL